MPIRAQWKILIRFSGCLPLCVRIQGVIPQRIVFHISVVWLSFEILLLFCDFISTPCSLGCRPMFLDIVPVSRWCWTIYVPGIVVHLYYTGSLLCYWHHYYVSWRLVRPFPLGGFYHWCVCEFVDFYLEYDFALWGEGVFSYPLGFVEYSHYRMLKK